MSGFLDTLEGIALLYGYPGVFAVSLIGSLVPFLPLPYLAVVVVLSTTKDPLLLGVIAGAGGAIGKTTSYLLGRSGYFLLGEESKKNIDVLHQVVAKYGALGVFLFAITPLPDDLYVIPVGLAKLPFWRFLIANLAGKMLLSVFVAYLGRTYVAQLAVLSQEESLPVVLIALSATVVLSVALMRADWVLAVTVAKSRGIKGLIHELPRILRMKKS